MMKIARHLTIVISHMFICHWMSSSDACHLALDTPHMFSLLLHRTMGRSTFTCAICLPTHAAVHQGLDYHAIVVCRALLDGFCEGVWPGEYEAGMRKMRAFEAQMRKQVRCMTQLDDHADKI